MKCKVFGFAFVLGILISCVLEKSNQTNQKLDQTIDVQEIVNKLGLNDKSKTEWAKIVGKKLADKPDLLTEAEQKALAQELLKEKLVRDRLEQSWNKGADIDEVWLYVAALGEEDPQIRRSGATALAKLGFSGVQLPSPFAAKAMKKLVDMLEDPQVSVRPTAASALGKLGSSWKGTMLDQVAGILLKKVEHTDEKARHDIAHALGGLCRYLKGKSLDNVVENLLVKLESKEMMVRHDTVHALAHFVDKLDGELFEGVVKGLIKQLEDVTVEGHLPGTFINLKNRLGDQLLNDAISGFESSLKGQVTEGMRKELQRAHTSLKARKMELEKN